jgi:hypothetical protein
LPPRPTPGCRGWPPRRSSSQSASQTSGTEWSTPPPAGEKYYNVKLEYLLSIFTYSYIPAVSADGEQDASFLTSLQAMLPTDLKLKLVPFLKCQYFIWFYVITAQICYCYFNHNVTLLQDYTLLYNMVWFVSKFHALSCLVLTCVKTWNMDMKAKGNVEKFSRKVTPSSSFRLQNSWEREQ